MENKNINIDDFLFQQLGSIEIEADKQSYETLFKHLDHLKHPIDDLMNQKLSDISIDVSAQKRAILSKINEDNIVIDDFLNTKLRKIEISPSKASEQAIYSHLKHVKTRRKSLILISILLTMTAIGLIVSKYSESKFNYSFINKNNIKNSIENSKTKQKSKLEIAQKSKEKTQNLKPSLVQKTDVKKSIPVSMDENLSNNGIKDYKVLEEYDNTVNFENPINSKTTNYYGEQGEKLSETFNFMKLIQVHKFNNSVQEQDRNTIQPKHTDVPKIKFSPFSICVSQGIIIRKKINSGILDKNIHKDELQLIDATIDDQKGMQIGVQLAYHFYKKINFQIGVQVNQTQSNNPINYIHREVPVYDSTGSLKGYLLRSTSQSPIVDEQIKSTQTTMNIPISIRYQLIQFKKLELGIGLGFICAIGQTSKGQFYNFKSEKLEDNSTRINTKIQPNFMFQLLTPIGKQTSISLESNFSWQNNTYKIHNLTYTRKEFTPTLLIGLRYTPIIKLP